MSVQVGDDERRDRKKPQEPPKKLPTVSLTLVSFAVTRKAYERITQRFAAEYEAATGQAVRFRLSFGGSGTQVCRKTSTLSSFYCQLQTPWNLNRGRARQLSWVDCWSSSALLSKGCTCGVLKQHAYPAQTHELLVCWPAYSTLLPERLVMSSVGA